MTQVWASEWPAVHRAPRHQLQHGRRIVFNIHNPLAHLTSLVCNSWNKLFMYLCLVHYLCFLFVSAIWKLNWVAARSASKSYFEPDIDIKQLFIGFCAICTMVRVFLLQTHLHQYKYKCNNNSIKSILLLSKVRDWYETVFDWIPCKMHSFEYRSTSAGFQWFISEEEIMCTSVKDSDIEFESNWIGFEIKWRQEHLSQYQNTIHDSCLPLKFCSKTGKNDYPLIYYLLAPGNCCKFEH